MASNGKNPRFRTVDSHSLYGGGPELLELVTLPTSWWIVILVIKFPFKHRVFGLVLLISVITLFTGTGLLLNLAIVLACGLILLYLYTWYRYAYSANFTRLTTAIMRRWWVHYRWPKALKDVGFKTSRHLRKVKYTPNGLYGEFVCDQGKDSDDLKASSSRIGSRLKTDEIKIDANLPYLATVSLVWGDPTSRVLLPDDLEGVQGSSKDSVAFALDADHQPLSISIETSLLIIGESNSGKSNCLWSILNGLNDKQLPYKLWVIDPAGGVELHELEHSPNTLMYAGHVRQSDELITRAHSSMHERLEMLKGNTRKYEISSAMPLNVIIIDELLLMNKYDQNSLLGEILSSGRKAGYIVIALSQLSQVDALGRVRDLFPQRICHATKSADMTEAALGSDAETSGAKCSAIRKKTPGVGYFFSEDTRLYTRFRTPLITDHNTKVISQGNKIQNTIVTSGLGKKLLKRPTSLYRYYGQYGDEYGRLLYVGIAYDPKQRWSQHCNNEKERWCPADVDTSLTEIVWYPSRKEAKLAETKAIQEEHPVYNKQERDDYRGPTNTVGSRRVDTVPYGMDKQ